MLALKEKDSSVTDMNSLVPGTDETFAQKAKRLSDEANKQMTIEYKTAYYNLMKKYYLNLELGMPLGFTIYPKQSTSAIPTKAKESTSAIPTKAKESTSAIPTEAKGGSLSFRERAELIRMRETLKALQKQNDAIEKSLDRQQKHLEKILNGVSKDNAQILRKIL